MKQNGIVVLLLSAVILFGPGCVSEQGIDKKKFLELNRIVQELKTAITSGKPCDVRAALLQRLASGTEALKDNKTSQDESSLLAAYSQLVTTYQDGLLLCKHQSPSSQYQFVPKGRIYVFQELDPLVQKYGFSTEDHLYKPTGVRWRSISADAILVVWESAAFQIKNIENMVSYN